MVFSQEMLQKVQFEEENQLCSLKMMHQYPQEAFRFLTEFYSY